MAEESKGAVSEISEASAKPVVTKSEPVKAASKPGTNWKLVFAVGIPAAILLVLGTVGATMAYNDYLDDRDSRIAETDDKTSDGAKDDEKDGEKEGEGDSCEECPEIPAPDPMPRVVTGTDDANPMLNAFYLNRNNPRHNLFIRSQYAVDNAATLCESIPTDSCEVKVGLVYDHDGRNRQADVHSDSLFGPDIDYVRVFLPTAAILSYMNTNDYPQTFTVTEDNNYLFYTISTAYTGDEYGATSRIVKVDLAAGTGVLFKSKEMPESGGPFYIQDSSVGHIVVATAPCYGCDAGINNYIIMNAATGDERVLGNVTDVRLQPEFDRVVFFNGTAYTSQPLP